MNLNNLMYGDKYPIKKVEAREEEITLYVKSKIKECKCPECGMICKKTHNKYTRHIQDTPIHNKQTWIDLTCNEFKCSNKNCNVKTFTEDITFVGKNQVMTYYLQYYIVILAIYMSSSSTSLILSLIGVKASADTVDNLLKNIEIKDNPDVEEIGIDDVALRKGISYATAIYDLKTHQLIALLKGREKDDIIPWLKAHPKIKIVARDRASAYAEAITEVFPNAIQIADRFHLFMNLTKYLKDMLYKELPDKIVIKDGQVLDKKATKVIKELTNIDESILNNLHYDNIPPVDNEGNIISFISTQNNLNSKLAKKQAENRLKKYKMIKDIHKSYYKLNIKNLTELSQKYKISITSLRKYLKMTSEEIENIKERKIYNTKDNEMKSYSNIIYKMLVDDIEYEYIFAYIKKLGFQGKDIQLRNNIFTIATNNNIRNIKYSIHDRYEYAKDETIITRYELLKYILTLDEKKDKNSSIEENIKIIKERYSIVEEIEEIFKEFHNTIFNNEPSDLDKFIEKYKEKITPFCKGLKKDIAAVKNAISNSINSGFVEGNNNKFKLIKRIVYGKQKICNLFKRCWLNFTSTLDDIEILKLVINPFLQNKK